MFIQFLWSNTDIGEEHRVMQGERGEGDRKDILLFIHLLIARITNSKIHLYKLYIRQLDT